MTAHDLLTFLTDLQAQGVDLSRVTLNYRWDDVDSDVEKIRAVSEDLYDAETNNVLESIMFVTYPEEMEIEE